MPAGSKRRLFHYFLDVAKRVGPAILDRRAGVAWRDRLLYRLGELLVYGPLKNTLGISRVRLAYTAGEAIGPDLFTVLPLARDQPEAALRHDRELGVPVHPEGRSGEARHGRRADRRASRSASPRTARCCSAAPARSSAITRTRRRPPRRSAPDGWVHTGDAGFFDADGQLKILDRARDVGRLAGGALFAPKFIENKLKFFPYIKEAVAFGDGRPFVAAFINIDLEAVGDWAERRSLAYASYQELAGDDGGLRSGRRAASSRSTAISPPSRPRRLADPPLPDPAQGARRR